MHTFFFFFFLSFLVNPPINSEAEFSSPGVDTSFPTQAWVSLEMSGGKLPSW